MIRLTDHESTTVEINIIRYEFPEVLNDEWDSNWLMVGMSASIGGKSWKALDPAVDAVELGSLVSGLRKLVADHSFVLNWQPLEPCLAIDGSWLESKVDLIVTLAHEFGPTRSVENAVMARFQLTPSDLDRLVEEVQTLSERFPVR